jgi:hypothetical protein
MAYKVLSRHGSPSPRSMRRPLLSAPALVLCLVLAGGTVLVESASGRPFMTRGDRHHRRQHRFPSPWNRCRRGCDAATGSAQLARQCTESSCERQYSPPLVDADVDDADADAHYAFVGSGIPEGHLLGETKTAKLTMRVQRQETMEEKTMQPFPSSVSRCTPGRSVAPLLAFSDLQVV